MSVATAATAVAASMPPMTQHACAQKRASINGRLQPTVCYHRCECRMCYAHSVKCRRCGVDIPATTPSQQRAAPPPIADVGATKKRRRRRSWEVSVVRDGLLYEGVNDCVQSLMPTIVRRGDGDGDDDDIVSYDVHWSPAESVVEGRRRRNGRLSFSSANFDDTGGVARRRRALMSVIAHRAAVAIGVSDVEIPMARHARDISDAAAAADADGMVIANAAMHGRVVFLEKQWHSDAMDARLATPDECRRVMLSAINADSNGGSTTMTTTSMSMLNALRKK